MAHQARNHSAQTAAAAKKVGGRPRDIDGHRASDDALDPHLLLRREAMPSACIGFETLQRLPDLVVEVRARMRGRSACLSSSDAFVQCLRQLRDRKLMIGGL